MELKASESARRDHPVYAACTALELERHKGVLVIGLNRPSKRNAIGVEMTLEIERTLTTAMSDCDLKAIVIHGIGGHFSAGMDMKAFFDLSDRSEQELRRARAATDNWRARLLRRIPCPIIASVSGYCLGGAVPLVECSNVVLASTDAVFGLPEINFSFVPGGPIAKSIRRAVPIKAASYLALTGRPIDASQALQWGLVSQIVEGNPLAQARALAARIAESEI